MPDFILRDGQAKIQTVAELDLCYRYLKHELPDGDYSIEGPQTDMTLYKIDGVLYPSGGVVNGERVTPRSKAECKQVFNEPESEVTE